MCASERLGSCIVSRNIKMTYTDSELCGFVNALSLEALQLTNTDSELISRWGQIKLKVDIRPDQMSTLGSIKTQTEHLKCPLWV